MKAKTKTALIASLAVLDCVFGGLVVNSSINPNHSKNIDIKTSANYVVVSELNNLSGNIKETVRDKEAPKISGVKDITIYAGDKVDLFKDIVVTDNVDEELQKQVIGKYDLNKVGVYSLAYEVKDNSDNVATSEFKLIVKERPDTEAPKISGVKNITIYVGSKVDFYSNVIITDNKQGNVKKEIVGNYNVNKAGTYNLSYKATDTSGNVSTSNFKLIVKNKVTTTTTTAKVTGNKATYQAYAKTLCLNTYGWTINDFNNLVKLWTKESGWNVTSGNSSSGAYGIPQALPAKKMASEGSDYLTNYKTQIRWGLKYVKSRYGNPTKAWQHFQTYGWY